MRDTRFGWRTIATVVVVAVAVMIGMIVLAENSDDPAPPVTEPARIRLELAVWGPSEVVAAYEQVASAYNATTKGTTVKVASWPTADAMLAAMRSGAAKPDLYMLPREDLPVVMAEHRNVPLLDLMNAREVPIGDDFARDAISAFSVNDDLQCVPYTRSPMVMYYNTRLVDFEAMDAAGLPTPSSDHKGWNLAEFRAAAQFASRPRQGTRGVYVEPNLAGLVPFIVSGGGKVFDSDTTPTSLALGDDASTDALRLTLELLRDPRLTLSAEQLSKRSALEWFERGKLAMIAGYRGLTPQLRQTEGLEFDVLPMPSLGSSTTVAEATGVCLGPNKPARIESSANFLTYLLGDEAVSTITETGWVQPTNLTVALSPAFLQPELSPAHAEVFNAAVRGVVLAPLLENLAELSDLVNPDILELLTTAQVPDLAEALKAIDERSRSLLDPDYVAEEPSSDGVAGTEDSAGSEDSEDSAD